MTTQSLDLNLIPKGISPRLYVSQYDKGQTWTFNIYAGNTAYTIPNGATVTIQGTKPDKTGFQYSCTVSGNVVTATEQQQMTVIAGEVPAEIRITNNNEIIATLNFILVVEPAALTDETEISETDLPIIEQAIEMLPHYQEMIDEVSSDIGTLSNVRAELGAHNLIDINAYRTLSNTSITNNGIVSTATDSRNASIYFRCFKGSTAVGNALINQDISTGQFSKEITIPSNYDFDTISIGHNGASKDLKVSLPFSRTGTFIFSCNVTGANTSVSGGYALEDIMLRLASDTDPTYQPYAKPNTELTKDTTGLTENAFANDAVNLLENKASSAADSSFTMIVNDNKSVTANGSGSIYFILHTYTQDEFNAKFAGKSLKISGTPESLLSNDIRIYAEIVSSGTRLIDEYYSPIYTMPTVSGSVRFYIKINGTVTNAVFKPMITVADMPNSDYAHYVPYAKSNRELTDVVEQVQGSYQFMEARVVTVNKDNVKTISTLLDELYAAINNIKTNLASNEYLEVVQTYIHGMASRPMTGVGGLRSSTSTLTLSTATLQYSNSTFYLKTATLKASGSTFNTIELSSDGNILTDLSSTVETVDNYNAQIRIYKTIS